MNRRDLQKGLSGALFKPETRQTEELAPSGRLPKGQSRMARSHLTTRHTAELASSNPKSGT
ncbi:hypothetical protein GLOTRDRAFT_134224 [Gloeophyllum trabeum ATCC 11539]|uniref:Uncharacterized protein n=1 Tax=Gloeophyllum trabeum (strain ATCC 11539 / FP-39264 / Madison 617) TaxID=670483 RepID=S7PQP7_GLOTA|nr:uncharacterized protein GLOTRDRAFT_134224 [Gloeophyllum trabeum ATCC 11539]EPQ50136.1 hypothetical protein GLOTRDRAFT_134224 [Gloeophyllum trabeum ATCC 11539]